jgi:hypothetical protein
MEILTFGVDAFLPIIVAEGIRAILECLDLPSSAPPIVKERAFPAWGSWDDM